MEIWDELVYWMQSWLERSIISETLAIKVVHEVAYCSGHGYFQIKTVHIKLHAATDEP
jgi:hypothetical protein